MGNSFDLNKYADHSPLELIRIAASKLPIPARVMNEKVRNYSPSEDELYFTIPDGRYVNRIYSGVKLRKFEQEKVNAFRAWVAEN